MTTVLESSRQCAEACSEAEKMLRERVFEQADNHGSFFALLEEIKERLTAGIAYLTPDLAYWTLNEQLAEINGLPAEYHLGKSLRQIVPDLASHAEAAMKAALASGEPLHAFEVAGEVARQPAAVRRWKECYFPVTFDGEIMGLLALVHEIDSTLEPSSDDYR